MEHQFEFTPKLQRLTYILMGIGVVALVLGIIGLFGAEGEEAHHLASTRLWSNIYINTFFFFGISIISTFFLALQYAAEAAWATAIKRIMEAISSFVPIGAGLLILVFLGGTFHIHHLFHWMDPDLFDPASPHYDEIIAGKQGYLNQPFFWFRALLFLGVWIWYTRVFRARSIQADQLETVDTSIHFKNVRDAAIFLVFFGFTSSIAAWDWIMSIDTHWFSTLFGWYVFSGWWISGMVTITMILLYLKAKGKLPEVNPSHLHDLGKWIFAISFLWTYLFFSQFMLIWYSDIPEEVTYFLARIENYTWTFWGTMVINFLFPMLFLMDRDNKRNKWFVIVIGSIVVIGHWLDTYMLITPGTMKEHGTIGLFEIGLALGFLGFFLNIVLRALASRPLLVKQHPFLEESLHHEIH